MNDMHRRKGDEGFAAVWTAVVSVAMVLLVALVLDGGAILRARSRAFTVAGSAARTGAQALDDAAAVHGDVVLDPAVARAEALGYLQARDLTGTVLVTDNEVTVTVVDVADLQILPGAVTIRSTATVAAIEGPLGS